MTKIKLFIVLTLLTLSVLLIPNLKSADASTKQDYILTAPPIEFENYGATLWIEYIKYHITYYNADNLYFLGDIDISINTTVGNVLDFTFTYNGYLPSDIKYIGLMLSPVYEWEGQEGEIDYRIGVELWYRDKKNNLDYLIRDNLGTIVGLEYYDFEGFNGFFCYTFTDISNQYNLGYNDGSKDAYTSGYNKGYQTGLKTAENDFNSLFWGIADVPSQVLFSVLSFEIFGVNAFSILFSILTVLLIAWLIKRFIA